MASGGKKKSKSKGKTLALNEFLANDSGVVPAPVVAHRSWAAEMDSADGEEPEDARITFDRSVLPTAPKAARGSDVDMATVPTKPPFTAFIGNLAYDACEEKIMEFFKQNNLPVLNVRLPNENGRQRGFGYVEFETRTALIESLSLNESTFCGRKLRVDLAGHSQGDRDRGESRSDRDDWRGGGGDPSRTEGDWRRKDGPSGDDRGGERGDRFGDRYGDRHSDRFGDDRDRGFSDRSGISDRGPDRFGDRRGGGRYGDRGDRGGERFGGDRGGDGYGGDRGGDRFGGGRYGDREESKSGGGDRYGSDRGGGRYGDRDDGRYGGGRRGFSDRYRDGDRYGRDERRFDDDRGFGGRRSYGGGFRREEDSQGPDGYRGDRPTSRESSQDAPKERPRLHLQPRTKPIDAKDAVPTRQSSIFGAAKPVDTAAREKEIEERLLRELEHHPNEEEKENRYGSKDGLHKDSVRQRRDSDRSDGGRGRERRLSSSSGKTSQSGSSWKDGESSKTPEDTHGSERDSKSLSSKTEEVKMVPAPPPKENAWSRPRKEDRKKSDSDQDNKAPSDSGRRADSDHHEGDRKNGDKRDGDQRDSNRGDRRGSGGESERQAGYGRGSSGGKPDSRHSNQKRASKEKALPKSIDEMPKLDQGPPKDWADKNKFSFLGGEEGAYEEEGEY